MRTITLVKKIKADGSPCRKCADVLNRLEREGFLDDIDRVVVADERDSQSEGMRLAGRHRVERAPFFIVEDGVGAPRVYTVYFQFLKDVLRKRTDEHEELAELLAQHPELDFI